jgi:hypothetical protein
MFPESPLSAASGALSPAEPALRYTPFGRYSGQAAVIAPPEHVLSLSKGRHPCGLPVESAFRKQLVLSSFSILTVITLCISCSPEKEFPVDESALGYFSQTYDESRDEFKMAAVELLKSRPLVQVGAIPVPSKTDKDLTIDYLYLPPSGIPKRLLILTSGLHGIEGFTGSAVQRMFIKEFLPGLDNAETGVLVVHAINPWGFRHKRRVTENNVDLNRNFSSSPDLYKTPNPGYAKLNGWLNPTSPADPYSMKNLLFKPGAALMVAWYSMPPIRQAVLQGQYDFEKGIFYGGKAPEPQKALIDELLSKYCSNYKIVLLIDLHTGYGERSRLHLFGTPVKDTKVKKAVEKVFSGTTVDWGDTRDFYTNYGDFSIYAAEMITSMKAQLAGTDSGSRLVLPMAFEFGTMDSQTLLGSMDSIHNMVLENQGFHNGFDHPRLGCIVRGRFSEMFYPSSDGWRSETIRSSKTLLDKTLNIFIGQDLTVSR